MQLVKIIIDDDGEKVYKPKWHYAIEQAGGMQTLCTGEYFGFGESTCEYKTKEVERFGKNCPDCLAIIKEMKAIKL